MAKGSDPSGQGRPAGKVGRGIVPRKDQKQGLVETRPTGRLQTRRQVRGELRRGSYLEQLLEALPYPIFVKDGFGVYTYCNAAFGEAVGKAPEEVIGRTVFDLVSPQQAQRHLMVEDRLRKTGGFQIYEVPLVSPEGGLRLWRLHKVSVRGRSNEPVGFAGLMTPSRELARKVSSRKSRRDELVDVQTMLTVVAHELHSPLASIRASAELLKSRKLPAGQRRELVHLIHQQSQRMGEVLSDLVDVTRLQLGSADWHWQRIEVGKVLEPCLDLARTALAKARGSQFRVRPAEKPVWIDGDPEALRRLVNALLSNAVQYAGGSDIELGWGMVEEQGNDHCWITIQDWGPGLPPWVLERLDRPFSLSCGLIGVKQAAGTGLGLTLAKGIIEAHQGSWEVESAPGAGTRFRILLPRCHRRMRRANSES